MSWPLKGDDVAVPAHLKCALSIGYLESMKKERTPLDIEVRASKKLIQRGLVVVGGQKTSVKKRGSDSRSITAAGRGEKNRIPSSVRG